MRFSATSSAVGGLVYFLFFFFFLLLPSAAICSVTCSSEQFLAYLPQLPEGR